MHFTQVTFKNFGPFEYLHLDLKRGSIGIFGPNGKGKTTILTGMYGCLTNDFRRFDGVKADCIRNTSDSKVESYIYGRLEHNGHTLSIKRGLYPARTSVSIDNGKEITDSNKAQEEIDRVLGVDSQMLSLYVFKPQDKIYDFISSQPADRAKAFSVLCRTGQCEEIWDFLGKFLNKNSDINAVITDNSDELLTSISNLKAQVSELESSINTEKGKLLNTKSEQSAREIISRQERLEDLLLQQQKEKNRVNDLNTLCETLTIKHDKRFTKFTNLKNSVESSRSQAEEARASLKAWQQYVKYRQRRRQLKDELEALKVEEMHNHPPEPREGDAPLSNLRDYLAAWRKQLKDAKALVAVFESTGQIACPTCNTPVGELKDYLTEQKELILSLPKSIKAVEDQIASIEQYTQDSRKFEKWKSSYDARVLANYQAREAIKDVKAPDGDEKSFQSMVDSYEQSLCYLEEAKDHYQEVLNSLNAANANLTASKRRLAEIASAIEENTESDDRVTRARQRLDEHSDASLKIASLEGELKGLSQLITEKENDLTKLRNKLKRSKKVRRAASIAEEVRELMHRDNLPRVVAQSNLANMEGDINEGLEAFGSPFWIETDENLTFIAHKPGEPPQAAGRLSTGQRVVLALSFWPAVASLWSTDLGMLALDEPTANLDEDNRKFLALALGTLTAKVRGRRQLIMVTHDSNLRTAFDQVVDLNGGQHVSNTENC